jgi:hypothetical protein
VFSDTVPPPGSRGLILGEILGSKAGDASTELLDLFFDPRAAVWGVFLQAPSVPFIASICGLWLAEADIPGRVTAGEGNGWNPGVLAPVALSVGVAWPSECVSSRESGGLLKFAASGNAKPSIPGSSTSIS